MTSPRFIQIHSLHSYPAALLNRDDSGLAKRLPYGGVLRGRVSSQCLKRHWRVAEDAFALKNIPGAADAVRSREVVTMAVMEPVARDSGADHTVIDAVKSALNLEVYGKKGDAREGRQPLLLGQPEIDYLKAVAMDVCRSNPSDAKAALAALKDIKANLAAMREQTALPGGLAGALFGRMVTSDTAANLDASIHVAHAFTVHEEESESDYFTAVDDLTSANEEEASGAGHIGDVELTSGLYYGYVVVDLPGLRRNLAGAGDPGGGGDATMAGQVVQHLLHLIATVAPGAKLGSTAPYGYADLMLVEAGARQPRSLANAFRNPVAPSLDDAVDALKAHLDNLDAAYGPHEDRRLLSVNGADLGMEKMPLPDLAEWARDLVAHAET